MEFVLWKLLKFVWLDLLSPFFLLGYNQFIIVG